MDGVTSGFAPLACRPGDDDCVGGSRQFANVRDWYNRLSFVIHGPERSEVIRGSIPFPCVGRPTAPNQTPDACPIDEQEIGVTLNLAAEEGQKRIASLLGDTEFLILDNRSTLVSSGRENDAESWNSMQSWLLKLRCNGVSVLTPEHAGRNGEARGTSKREDVLDTVIQLKRGEDYQLQQGACFEVHLTKARGIFGEDAAPFEARVEIRDGVTSWHVRDLR